MDFIGFAARLKLMGAKEYTSGWIIDPYVIEIVQHKHKFGILTLINLYKEKSFIDVYKQTYDDYEKIMYIISESIK